MRRFVLLGLLAGSLAVPGLASAQTAPPGNSAIDEYVESVPSATGNRPVRPRGENGGGGADVLSAEQRRALEAQGADGRRVIEQIESGAPAAPRRPDETGAVTPPAPSGGGNVSGDSPIRAIVDVATGGAGSSGMGPVLPILLVGTLALFAAVALLRRRTG